MDHFFLNKLNLETVVTHCVTCDEENIGRFSLEAVIARAKDDSREHGNGC